jgi:hypothetical protein
MQLGRVEPRGRCFPQVFKINRADGLPDRVTQRENHWIITIGRQPIRVVMHDEFLKIDWVEAIPHFCGPGPSQYSDGFNAKQRIRRPSLKYP